MNKILNWIWDGINILGKLNVDIEKTEDGKIKICITIDPKAVLK